MQTIKFRAWDKLCKRYWYSGFSISPTGKVDSLCSEIQDARIKAGWTIDKSYTEECGFDLELFTGKLNKNGKEIYGGDRIAAAYYCPVCYDTEPHQLGGTVEWNDEQWMFDYGHGAMPLCSEDLDDIEIIGNVHIGGEAKQ